jgi:hypothetical protein
MLPESVAIVLAPHHNPSQGVFRLTSDGLERMRKCNDPRTFHPHTDELDLYVEISTGVCLPMKNERGRAKMKSSIASHLVWADVDREAIVVDLR